MDETLKSFLENIDTHAGRELEQLSGALDDREKQAVAQARAEAAQAAEDYRRAQLAQVRDAGDIQVAARAAENRRKLVEYRQACARETEAEVVARVRRFTGGPDYPVRLAALLKQALDSLGRHGEAVVYLRREDMAHADYLRRRESSVGLTVREGDFALGGLIVAVPQTGLRTDMSFDTALREACGRFAELSGMALT